MKIYWEGIPIDEVPDHIHRPGELFTRLVGVRVSSDGKSVEPLYISLIQWSCRAGQVVIEINSYSRPLVYITFQRRKPFFSFFRFQWESLEAPIGGL